MLLDDARFSYMTKVHYLKADLGMAGWFYQAAVYIILMIALDLQAKGD